jgi:NadR type nicotinamide-nucleotide adenylyltransferase
MTVGVVIGKFYPLHLGHEYLIKTAARAVAQLTVIVCERPDQRLSGELRGSWIRAEHPDVEVVVTPDDLPERPEPWAERTLELLRSRRPDLVFSSEDYGDDYAELMGASHVRVDVDRVMFPISGTQLRADLARHWDMLTPPAKAYFARRVVVTGVEASGTTTLAEDLARRLRTVWVPEHGRWYWEGRRYLADQRWDTQEFIGIAQAQITLEEALARRANRILIADTDALTTHVWHRRYVGTWSKRVEAVADSRSPHLYIVTLPDFPFVQDGTREGETIRMEMHQWLIETLVAKKRNYVEVGGDRESRMAAALARIKNLPAPRL